MEQKNSNRVSVALAVYNGEKYLPQLLASLESQSLQPAELVVLDDCSQDNSLTIIKQYPLSFPKKVFSNDKNCGPIFTFKKLAELCSEEFIAFCDQDDVWLPTKIEKSLTEIQKISSDIPGLVFTDLSVINQDGDVINPSYWKVRSVFPERFTFPDILFGNIVTGCTVMINKRMAGELVKMPLNIIMHDWWMALLSFSFGQYRYLRSPTVLFRSHEQSVTTKSKTGYLKMIVDVFKHRAGYLQENFQQAAEFRRIYSGQLDEMTQKQLDSFIRLGNKAFFYKMLVRNIRSLKRRIKVDSFKL